MAKKEYVIHTIEELLDTIREIKFASDSMERALWFRGHADRDWDLIPSIQRDLAINSEEERMLTNEFRVRTSQVKPDAPDREDYSSWMSLMQHYGLATRLLDWTKSPLIALFFAVENAYTPDGKDACLWVLRPEVLNKHQIDSNKVFPIDSITVEEMLRRAFKDPYRPSGREDEEEWLRQEQWGIRGKDKIVACYSVEHDLRMYSQQACFTAHDTQLPLTEFAARYAEEFPEEPALLTKLLIPDNCKLQLIRDLKLLGITVSFVYPDMSHISRDVWWDVIGKVKNADYHTKLK